MTNDITTDFGGYLAELNRYRTSLQTWNITDQAGIDFATKVIDDVKSKFKEAETYRKSLTDTPRKQVEEINDRFRPVTQELLAIENALKTKILDYRRGIEEHNRRKQQEVQAQLAANQMQMAVTSAHQMQEQAQVAPNVQIREKWSFRVTDPSKVPANFYTLDVNKIAEHVKQFKNEVPIPGVEIFREETLAFGARRS